MSSQETLSIGLGFVRIKLALRSHKAVTAAALAAVVTLCSTNLLQDAVANGDTRTLSFHHVHSGANATVTFKRNGRYDPAALKQLNVLMQDWRRKEPTNMDPQLFDIVWEVYREVDATQPIQVIGGYRSPATNAMLRSRSRGVAQTSLHMQGKAMDFYIPGVPLSKVREAGLRLQRGGVGFYPTSGSPFVHLDTGGVRHWPRMSRPELARVFPGGKTVHIPADGKPMPGYALALAEVESRGSEPGGAGAAFAGLSGGNNPKRANSGATGGKNIFAALFSRDDDDEESAAPAAAAAPRPAPAEVAQAPAPKPAAPAPVDLASADPVPLPQPNPLPRMAAAALAPVPSAPAAPPVPASSRMELAALAAAIPLPDSQPAQGRPTGAAMLPSAGTLVPRPPARPSQVAGLPELIVRGTDGEGPVLAYADAAGSLFPTERLQPGRAPAPPAGSAEASRQMPASAAASAARKLRGHSAEMLAEIRRLFSSPTVAHNVSMHTPELRRFAAFVAPPRQVVEVHFGHDGSNGLTTAQFSGAAVVAVPVVAMVSGPAPLKNPL